jgi:hypothetical protein
MTGVTLWWVERVDDESAEVISNVGGMGRCIRVVTGNKLGEQESVNE